MKIIVIIDAQNDFINMALGSKEAVIAADNIVKYLHNYNDPETLILFTKDTHYENYLETAEGKKLPVPHCIAFTPGWSIYKPISQEVDYTSGKFYSYSAENVRVEKWWDNEGAGIEVKVKNGGYIFASEGTYHIYSQSSDCHFCK